MRHSAQVDEIAVARTLGDQDGVISRAQLLELGASDADIRRMIRRRSLAPIGRGAYLNHTGLPTWEQQVWAVCLALGAVAAGRTALRLWLGAEALSPNQLIEVIAPWNSGARSRPGIRVDRVRDWEGRARPDLSPPKERLEHAVLSEAARLATGGDAIELLAKSIRRGHTTPARLTLALSTRERLPHRRWLAKVLADIEAGSHSVLEREYLQRVERPHGLPRGQRQVKAIVAGSSTYRDLEHLGGAVIVELDGAEFHTSSQVRAKDAERDLWAAATGARTVRLGWHQVHKNPCQTAALLGEVLSKAGWSGHVTPCGTHCPVRRVG